MSRTIRNVALAGASGNVGAQVLKALLAVKEFNVTVLSRSPKSFPAGAQIKVVDFTSIEDLSTALIGQDAVIDTTSSPDVATPLRLIEAAAKAGVYRFITSDFGLDPELPGVYDLPVFSRKKASYEAVKKQAAENHMTYTLVSCGAFLDWCLSSGFAGLNFQSRTAWIFGDGNNVHPWTTLEDVGKATANVLLHPQETLNRPVYIYSVFMSQSQLFDIAKEVSGGEWTATYNDMEPIMQKALEDLRSGNISDAAFVVQIQYCLATKALAHPGKATTIV
ncbi:hypothetical protein N7509_010735 [Penicillium cosmopolitanum]|uniref:NAD(P)-binding domain-containing protein n=1 Tax=Penicillium cosmopolitanum TaxID=1131564 RepID=A0A9W9VS51_9EURO|nr:uncharacterized protein N7509_010735 [Penicillium cosmopolitanum]KAJ5388194.1 hypothetical protein N7509_010735 [Penicillium cosmopolitanum]